MPRLGDDLLKLLDDSDDVTTPPEAVELVEADVLGGEALPADMFLAVAGLGADLTSSAAADLTTDGFLTGEAFKPAFG